MNPSPAAEDHPTQPKTLDDIIHKVRSEHDMSELAIDPDALFESIRDREPGRDFEW